MDDIQDSAPLFDAVKRHIENGVVPFHVPGHKQGRGLPGLRQYVGERILQMDLNGMDDIDYMSNPAGVIRRSLELMARAFGADHAFFLVNGTTSGIQAMIMSACAPGEKLILPRNAHKSTVGGLILGGVTPVYVQPVIEPHLGVAMGMTVESVAQAIREHPEARAVFVINPTYYGMASDIKAIVDLAHAHGMLVLADEAHGSHLYFHDAFPLSAMAAGADLSTLSIHKTGGSLTQSSALLLKNGRVSPSHVHRVLELCYTSSASYLLMCSLDLARKQLALEGRALMENALSLARYAREKINGLEGFMAFGPELAGSPGCHAFDETKLGVNVSAYCTGCQMEALLREKYRIQVELSDLYNILAVVTFADRRLDLDALIGALTDISQRMPMRENNHNVFIPGGLETAVSLRRAFYCRKKAVKLEDSVGEVSGEIVMAYPPGIPVICLGERITSDIVEYIRILKGENCQLQGTEDAHVDFIRVLDRNSHP